MIYKAAKALASEVLAVHCISMFFWFSGLGEGLLPRRAIFDFCRHLCELLKVKERMKFTPELRDATCQWDHIVLSATRQRAGWYSIYRPHKDERLSLPSWLVTFRDGLPIHRWSPIVVLTGSDVAQLH